MPRAIGQHPALPFLARLSPPGARVHDHDLGRRGPGLRKEERPLCRLEVPVEVAGEEPVETALEKRQGERIPPDQASLRELASRLGQHASALVEGDDIAAQEAGQVTGAAGHVEHAAGGQARNHLDQGVEFRLPAGSGPRGEVPCPLVPVVVLAGPAVIVLPHQTDANR